MSVVTVENLMSKDVVALYEDEDLFRADALMAKKRSRHLPVVRGQTLVGLISHRDILKAYADRLHALHQGGVDDDKRVLSLLARDVMVKDVTTTRPDTPALDAAKTLAKNKYGCLPVLDDEGALVGIITEADFLAWAAFQLENSWRE